MILSSIGYSIEGGVYDGNEMKPLVLREISLNNEDKKSCLDLSDNFYRFYKERFYGRGFFF